MVCPLCGYTATLRAQMERHLALHNQEQDKVRYAQMSGETFTLVVGIKKQLFPYLILRRLFTN